MSEPQRPAPGEPLHRGIGPYVMVATVVIVVACIGLVMKGHHAGVGWTLVVLGWAVLLASFWALSRAVRELRERRAQRGE